MYNVNFSQKVVVEGWGVMGVYIYKNYKIRWKSNEGVNNSYVE